MEQLKLLSMTAVLTVLIWATADSLVIETVTLPAEFEVVPATGAQSLVVSSASEVSTFQVQLTGPRKVIAQAQAVAPFRVRLRVPEGPTGSASIDLKAAMEEQWRQFPKLTVVAVSPARLDVNLDHIVRREMRLEIEQPLALSYDTRPQLDRTSVDVRMLETSLRRFEASGRPFSIAIAPERLLEDQERGRPVDVQMTLVPAELGLPPDAELIPNRVLVRATLKSDRVTEEIGTVPILLATSFANFGRSIRAVTPDGSILVTRTIRVTGPAQVVDRMMRGDRPVGFIRLKAEHLDRPGVQQSFIPEFPLPPGVELAADPEPVVLTLEAVGG